MKVQAYFERIPDLFLRSHNVSWEKYEETIYHMRRPVTHGNYHRVLQFVGGNPPEMALRDERPYHELDRALARAKYPRAGQLTRLDEFGHGGTEAATALLHFNNPAYPIWDARTVRGLNVLGYPLSFVKEVSEEAIPAYQAYINTVQDLKDSVPFTYVPEKNYYLTRIIQMTLWQLGLEAPTNGARTPSPRVRSA